MTLAALRATASPIGSERINSAIARHALYVDLKAHRLTEPERTPIFCHHKAALTHHRRGKKSDDLGISAHPVILEQGSPIMWDGRPWRIAVGEREVTLVCDEGHPLPLSRAAFDALVKEGKIVGVQVETHSSITAEGEALLDTAREGDLATATVGTRVINADQ